MAIRLGLRPSEFCTEGMGVTTSPGAKDKKKPWRRGAIPRRQGKSELDQKLWTNVRRPARCESFGVSIVS